MSTSRPFRIDERRVTIWLPKARHLRHLSVKLHGRQDIGWPDSRPYESASSLEKEVALIEDDQDVLLERGEHSFSFSMIVPSSTAPYERCQFGRVRHSISARARGLGPMGGVLVSEDIPLYLIVNVSCLCSSYIVTFVLTSLLNFSAWRRRCL